MPDDASRKPMLPAVEKFVATVRGLFEQGLSAYSDTAKEALRTLGLLS